MKTYLAQEHQLRVWVDKRIDIGGSWKNEAEQRIAKSHCFLLLISPSAEASEWVRLELNYALSSGTPIFSALLEGDEQTAMLIKLAGTSYEKLTWDAGRGKGTLSHRDKTQADKDKEQAKLELRGMPSPTNTVEKSTSIVGEAET